MKLKARKHDKENRRTTRLYCACCYFFFFCMRRTRCLFTSTITRERRQETRDLWPFTITSGSTRHEHRHNTTTQWKEKPTFEKKMQWSLWRESSHKVLVLHQMSIKVIDYHCGKMVTGLQRKNRKRKDTNWINHFRTSVDLKSQRKDEKKFTPCWSLQRTHMQDAAWVYYPFKTSAVLHGAESPEQHTAPAQVHEEKKTQLSAQYKYTHSNK